MKHLVIVGALALLGGCVSAEQLAQADDAQCSSYGAPQGSPQYPQCRMMIAQDRSQRRQAALMAFSASMQAQAAEMRAQQQAAPPLPMPTTTNCYRSGNAVNCTTY